MKARHLNLGLIILAMIVVMLGAYTRLSHAGLWCPDWPGCYGHLFVPQTTEEISWAHEHYPNAEPVIPEKAWAEMIHRYFAGTLGLLVIAFAVHSMIQSTQPWHKNYHAIGLIGLIIFQAILGLWTVTWKLHPLAVMPHLLGGFSITLLLLHQYLGPKPKRSIYDRWAHIGLFLLFVQCFLGAWTSANYASLICPDFPFCQGQWFPDTSFREAFNLLLPIGENYQYGVLGHTARVTIHITHRFFALFVGLFIVGTLIHFYHKQAAPNHVLLSISTLLSAQILLGMINIVYLLPISAATLHNIGGLLLLMSWVWLTHTLRSPTTGPSLES